MSNLLARIVKLSICLLVFLLPIFWLPFSFEAFEYNKQYLLLFLVSIAFLAWLAKQILADKEIKFRRTPLDIPVLVFLFVAILSAFFSVDKNSSLFGFYGRFSDGLINLLSLGVLYFLITNNVGIKSKTQNQKSKTTTKNSKPEEEKISNHQLLTVSGLLKAFLWSVFFVVLISYFSIFGIWQKLSGLLAGKFQLPPIMLQRIFNPTAGSLEGLSIFLAVIIVFLAGYLLMMSKGKLKRFFELILFFAILFLLIIIDYTVAWFIILISLVLFVGFSLWKRIFKESVNKLLLPISLIFISVLFVFLSTPQLVQNMAGSQSSILTSLPKEQILNQGQSWLAGAKAAVENIKSGFLGSGPGTWHYDFAKFKSANFNQNWLWQIRFDRAGNHISEILGTMGILGILSYLFLIGMFSLISWWIINRDPKPLISGYQLPILLAFLAVFLSQFLYYQNTVLAFTFWLMLALGVTSWQKPIKERTISLKDFPELSLVFSIVLTVFALSFLAIYFFAGRFYLADVNYRQSLERGEIGSLERAVALNPDQPYYKIILSRAYFSEVLIEAQKPAEQRDQAVFTQNIYLAITYLKGGQVGNNYVKGVTELAPNRVAGWETLGMIYRDIQGMVGGAADWAIKSFEKAISLEPTNPVLHTELGKLYLIADDIEKAKSEFQKARNLKADYLDAVIQTALLLEKENNLSEAIREMEELAGSYPYNIEILFQLGRIYFNDKQTDKAISQFETIIALMPNHSNAHYSLGIAYQAKGQKEKAIAEFEKVLELNPGNQDIQAKLDELKEVKKETKK